MKATIIIITLCLISGQDCFSVTGCSGGSVMFKCMSSSRRESDDQFKGKYFCRDRDCVTGIRTETQRCWDNNERFSLYDDGNSSFFTVFIRNLHREDDGNYTCGNNQKCHRVTLVVNRNSSSCGTSVMKSAYIGQTITFSCEYDHGFEKLTKVLYRVNGDPVHVMSSSRSSPSSEKFILTDREKDHFTVTIRDTSAEDGGIYLCGVERYGSSQTITHITFIKEIELNVYNQITSVQAEAYISKSVFITCQFPQKFKGNKKFIQKDSSQKIPVDEQNQWNRLDKVHIYDDTREGVLKVFISDLTSADEGTYRCGVNTADDNPFSEITLKINPVDHFHASSQSAVIGDSVTLTCVYPEKHETIKHICKENEEKICQSSSETSRFVFSDSTAGVFTASISDVKLRDAGVYWCGAETRHTNLTSVSLTNKHQLTIYMIRREGESAEIRCPSNDQMCRRSRACSTKDIKLLCKGKCFTEDAQNIARSDEAHVTKPKISVKDDTELNLFTVTMTDLTAEDAGKYWCAVKDKFNLPVELMIIRKDAVTREASVGGSVVISCKHITNHNQRLFCRGEQPNICIRDGVRVSSSNSTNRFSLTEETSAGVFTVEIRDLRAEDSGKYWCGEESSGSFIFTEVQLHVTTEMTTSDTKRETSQKKEKPEMTSTDTKKEKTENSGFSVTAAVCVGLILLALVIALILFKLKHNKNGIISSTDRRQKGDHETAQEDIQDARLHSDSDPESAHLYSTVQSPTIPSDSQNALYSTVQSPTIPSDGLLYAAVSFQKHEESLSDATVRFSKNEIQCDYASVNHSITPN